jgi:transporter family-2 protein
MEWTGLRAVTPCQKRCSRTSLNYDNLTILSAMTNRSMNKDITTVIGRTTNGYFMNFAYVAAATLIGVSFAFQPAINAATARALGTPIAAAALSVSITLICCVIFLFATASVPKAASVSGLPWWVLFGGLIGAFVVAGGAAIVPVTGVAVFFVCLITGQLVGSVWIDHVGAFGVTQSPVSLTKLAGVAFALVGVTLVRLG